MNVLIVRSAFVASLFSLCLAGLLWSNPGYGSEKSQKSSGGSVKVIELFTSHGCSSCPAADHLLGELLDKDEDLIALEFHVDYWNSLVHGSSGNFVDPFSKSEYSMRQREYSVSRLAGRPGVYTPQAVINGISAAVGSNRRHIIKALKHRQAAALQITLQPSETDQTVLQIGVTGDQQRLQDLQGTDITLYKYIDSAQTRITGGENRDLVLTNHHIVYEVLRLGQVSSTSDMSYNITVPVQGEGCVVLVQEGALTPVFAAVECP
ncbi:MAG: hypothetical protein ACI9UN_001644 [Granulosicoccus sp.]|jgi:hypothetical protein